ncbi:MAG: DUF1232 domain-containing protein [Saprospiraceae bacterium]|nr:DUF1232 domain-containing protein [Saprospiraceae bacterium]MCB0623815.1 DUF1232 domain-containing protein [Saprospiraceae bacterium]MCB0675138.1 DUF1232 domain-containing protein [Saprospiraceae bacterium]MCB0679384.1 DUF1232 domain-containing protein [Saprospiraceae bacterium]
MKNPFKMYIPAFSESRMWRVLTRVARQIGLRTTYTVLLLFYAFKRRETPLWARNIILGTLGYLLSPLDALPDLTPVIGYTDDIGVLSFGLVTIACYVDEEIREKAREKLGKWFGSYDPATLVEVDKRL